MAEPTVDFTPEAPLDGETYARRLGLWVRTYGSKELDNFVADVKTLAAAADASARNAAGYSNQASKDAALAISARDQAAAQVVKATEQVALAKTQADQATQQNTLAGQKATLATQEADRAKVEADRAKKIVDEFDPGIYRYGFTQQVPQLEQDTILVSAVEYGYTYHLRKRSLCVLPSVASDPVLRVGQLVHFQSTDWAGEGFFVGHAGVTVLTPRGQDCVLIPRGRVTATYIGENTWSLTGDLAQPTSSLWVEQPGAQQYQPRIDPDVTGVWRRTMRHENGQFWLTQLRYRPEGPGQAVEVTANNPRFTGLPNGPVQFLHSTLENLTGELFFGWPGHDRTSEYPYYWVQNGINGIVSPIQIEGFLARDWRIVTVDVDCSKPVKLALFRLYNRLNDTYRSLVCTSTQGLLWDPVPYKKLNDHIGIREAFAHFPSVVNNKGKLFLREGTQLRLVTYDLLNEQYPSELITETAPKRLLWQRRHGDDFYALAWTDGWETSVCVGLTGGVHHVWTAEATHVEILHGAAPVLADLNNDAQCTCVWRNRQQEIRVTHVATTGDHSFTLPATELFTDVFYATHTAQGGLLCASRLTGPATDSNTSERFSLVRVTDGFLPTSQVQVRAPGGAVPESVLGAVRKPNQRENWRGDVSKDPWLAVETSVGRYYDYPKVVADTGGGGGRPSNVAVELTATGGTVTVEAAQADYVRVTLVEPQTTMTLTPPPAVAGSVTTCNLILRQSTGSNKVTWPSSVRWAYKQVPVLSFAPNEEDHVTLVNFGTDDYWYGFLTGGWFNG